MAIPLARRADLAIKSPAGGFLRRESVSRRAPHTTPTILVAESTGRPYRPDHFRQALAEVRSDVAREVPELNKPWFMDLRRTVVVWLAEESETIPQIAATSGHKLISVMRMLETYLPRKNPMTAAVIEKLARRRAARKRDRN